jgi:hypothetical protein|tara:strand:+ start:2731 stop:3069 length:339 start_codon:yes stop_codon:yes gene_type:complete
MNNDTHPDQVKAWIQSWNPEALLMDGFDAALVGAASRPDFGMVAVYDRDLCIDVLVDQGMPKDDAVEYFEYNCEQAYMGPGTPIVGCFNFDDISLSDARSFLSEAAEQRGEE